MAQQVGEGYIEVEPRINNTITERMFARVRSGFGRMWRNVDRDTDVHTKRISHHIGRNISRGVDAAISLLPGRMEALFSGRGGPIGLALGAALIAGVATTLPALGAMVSGALFAGFGTGVVAMGIALVAKDPRVVAAAQRLKQMFTDKVWDSKGAEKFAVATTQALDRITVALSRWAPFLDRMLKAGSTFVGPITSGLISFVDGFLGPMTKMVESNFMADIMKISSAGFGQIGQAGGDFFNRWLGDPAAMEGAKMGLRDLFDLTATLTRASGDFLRLLSRIWFSWNKDPDGAGGAVSKMERMRQLFSSMFAQVSKVGSALATVGKAIGGIVANIFSGGGNQQFFNSLKELGHVLIDLVLPAITDLVVRNLPLLNIAFTVVSTALRPLVELLSIMGRWFADPANRGFIDGVAKALIGVYIATRIYHAALLGASIAMKIFAVATRATAVALKVFGIAWRLLNVLFIATPIGLIITAIIALVAAIVWVAAKTDFFQGVWKVTWTFVKNVAMAVGSWFAGPFLGFFQAVWNGLKTGAANFVNFFQGVWNTIKAIGSGIANFFVGIGRFISSVWSHLWEGVAGVVIAVWNRIRAFLANSWLVAFFVAIAKIIFEIWAKFWIGMGTIVSVIWNAIRTVIVAVFGGIASFIGNVLKVIAIVWNAAWAAISHFFGSIWNGIFNFLRPIFNAIANFIGTMLGIISRVWNAIWGGISHFFGAVWNAIWNVGRSVFGAIANFIGRTLGSISKTWELVWRGVQMFFSGSWDIISGVVTSVFGGIKGFIETTLDLINRAWDRIWGGMVRGFQTFMSSVIGHAQNMIQGVVKIINKGIRLINWVLGKLGISAKIPLMDENIRLAGGGMVTGGQAERNAAMNRAFGLARGGTVRGPGGSTADRVRAMLSPGEYVIRASSAKKIGYDQLERMNSTGKAPSDTPQRDFFGLAPGGSVFNLMMAWARSNLPGVHFASTYRPGDPGYHGRGQAIDMTFSDGSERRGNGMARNAFNKIKGTFFTGIAELIWDFARGQAVWNGQNHFFTGAGAGPGTHNDHIHWAMGKLEGKGGGGLLSGVLEFLFMPWTEVLAKMVQPAINGLTKGMPDNGIGNIFKGAGGFLGKQIIPWIKGLFEKEQEKMSWTAGTLGDGGGGAARWASTIVAALKMLGLPANWLNPMITLIGRESGGNPNAVNRSDSNAARGTPSMGLAQVIGPTFSANRDPRLPNNAFHPLANIVAALNYIKRRYGSIFNVQQANASLPPRGYDSGGILPPGRTLAYNGTGANEYIFTGSQMDTMMNGGWQNYTTKVYIDGVEVAHRAVVEENNRDLINTIRRGRRGGR